MLFLINTKSGYGAVAPQMNKTCIKPYRKYSLSRASFKTHSLLRTGELSTRVLGINQQAYVCVCSCFIVNTKAISHIALYFFVLRRTSIRQNLFYKRNCGAPLFPCGQIILAFWSTSKRSIRCTCFCYIYFKLDEKPSSVFYRANINSYGT